MIPGDERRDRDIGLERERAARAEAASLYFVTVVLACLLAIFALKYINQVSLIIKNCNVNQRSVLFDYVNNRTDFIIG